MQQNVLAFKIVNEIVKIQESKNFFAIEKNSFYAEPLLFNVCDIFIPAHKLSHLIKVDDYGLYAITTAVDLHHSPKKKIIFTDSSITYEIYGIRTETAFLVHELRKKINKTMDKVTYKEQDLNSVQSNTIFNEIEAILQQFSNTQGITLN